MLHTTTTLTNNELINIILYVKRPAFAGLFTYKDTHNPLNVLILIGFQSDYTHLVRVKNVITLQKRKVSPIFSEYKFTTSVE